MDTQGGHATPSGSGAVRWQQPAPRTVDRGAAAASGDRVRFYCVTVILT
jgi:hypothetical protein